MESTATRSDLPVDRGGDGDPHAHGGQVSILEEDVHDDGVDDVVD